MSDEFDHRDPYRSGKSSVPKWVVYPVVILFGMAAVAGIAFASWKAQQQRANVAPPDCPAGVEAAMSKKTPSQTEILILVDVASNSDFESDVVASELSSLLTRTASSVPSKVTAVYDFGFGSQLVVEKCLAGVRTLSTKQANTTVERNTSIAFEADMRKLIKSSIRAGKVSPTGGPLRLLNRARALPRSKSQTWVLWSDLVANDGTCLDATGEVADSATALTAVNRCMSAGSFVLPDGVTLSIHGAGLSERSARFSSWAVSLQEMICTELKCVDDV
jgi:hypothetical protein